MDAPQILKDLFVQLTSATPEVLLAVWAIVFGYVLKGIPIIPNRAIPASVVAVCMVIYPFLIEENVKAPYTMKHPQVRLVVIGAVIGFIAWAAHALLLKKYLDPLLLKMSNGNGKPEEPTQPPKP